MSDNSEVVKHIYIKNIQPFADHPFEVRDDDAMKETVQSVKDYGVIMPVIVRQTDYGCYEMISGHRRMRACELAGIDTIPAIVRDVDRDTAIIMMVDSNLQRENILPSEKAKAYKMKLDAIKRQVGRPQKGTENKSVQVGQIFQGKASRDLIADKSPDSSTQIQRYIRLNELSPPLQKLVDEEKMGLTPAVEISYLKPEEQALLVETIESEQSQCGSLVSFCFLRIAVLAALLIFLLVFLGFKGCSDNPANSADRGLVYDDEAVSGGWDEADIEKIKEGLNEKVQAGMGYTVLLCFSLFKTGSLAKSIFNAH